MFPVPECVLAINEYGSQSAKNLGRNLSTNSIEKYEDIVALLQHEIWDTADRVVHMFKGARI